MSLVSYPMFPLGSLLTNRSKGHVFGLDHEHQRADARGYIDFKCENLADYDKVKAKVEAKGEDTMKMVCIEGVLANKYGFSGASWTVSIFNNNKSLFTWDGPFDTNSIM